MSNLSIRPILPRRLAGVLGIAVSLLVACERADVSAASVKVPSARASTRGPEEALMSKGLDQLGRAGDPVGPSASNLVHQTRAESGCPAMSSALASWKCAP